ncbi:MAG: NUDIX domain-containing protein [Paucibacter sp.]|nr:NUDIX domain-containing protein [Roseateles sp.]
MPEHLRIELAAIEPLDEIEQAHLADALAWIASGAPLYRTAKPATPPKHLVAYFAVVHEDHILLVNHRNALKWLPTGGHVEPHEDPRSTVVRELQEELGLEIDQEQLAPPHMVTVSETVGLTVGHVDVSLWYSVKASRSTAFRFDCEEFGEARWFSFEEASQLRSDPHLARFLSKLRADTACQAPTP